MGAKNHFILNIGDDMLPVDTFYTWITVNFKQPKQFALSTLNYYKAMSD